MGKGVHANECYQGVVNGGDDEQRVLEWEDGLPGSDDLTPLSQTLISPELASAFSITPEPRRSMLDVNRASQNTLSSIRGQSQVFSSKNLKSLSSFAEERIHDPLIVEEDENDPASSIKDESDARKLRRLEITEDSDSAMRTENSNDDPSTRSLKRPRLVWTPQLHKRFVDVVTHLGIKNAVPKTIMQLMNVEGLTRENVASHLQKYRLYLKRMQGLSNEGPSSSDHLFASTPVPQSLHESGSHGKESGHAYGQGHMPLPMPYGAAMMPMPMPVLGMAHGYGHMGMSGGNPAAAAYHGFDSHAFSMLRNKQGDWSANKFSPIVSYPHVTPNNK